MPEDFVCAYCDEPCVGSPIMIGDFPCCEHCYEGMLHETEEVEPEPESD